MNRFRFMLGLLLFSALLCLSAAAQETEHPEFLSFLNNTYDQVESYDAYYNTGFAVVRKGEKHLLGCFEKTQDGWHLVFENEKAVHFNSRCSIHMDTEDTLFLSIHLADDTWQSQDYRLKNSQWYLESVVNYQKARFDTDNPYYIESHANITLDEITLTRYLVDDNDNILSTRVLRPLPNVLPLKKFLLRTIDNREPLLSGEGYVCDETMEYSAPVLKGLFEKLVLPNPNLPHHYVDGVNEEDWLLFIADDDFGNRSLLCGAYDGGWSFTQSSPLPENTTFGIENFTTVVDLGNNTGAGIIRYNDGTWGIRYILSDELFYFFQNGLLNDNLYAINASIGYLPVNDITKINWHTLPKSKTQALFMLKTNGYATPNNPDKNDRLHLRKEPKQDAPSLGKYYNSTPLKVLQKKGEWTKVQIGHQEGWMMTKYLAFGGNMSKVKRNLLAKAAVHPVTTVYWFTKTGTLSKELWFDEATRVSIVGVIEDEWYLVWDPQTNAFGKICQIELWDGNGLFFLLTLY